ncbi:MAG TPA: glycosyltransferase family 2 protein [Pyrinomonadaceae bacterium]|nr:glycosyltransferase family 2 protein [Chloracidobacterium sp.]MBP9935639.1 glycosyltransferase family 2 protein [Pyrinomonadaceae bacterium]MBK7802262.1 glycosyltransferase family 2 protein [Chloracidobacterium sp.]MBK9437135.1 glycosyltransferase family 2 protein [Chloracidobacterium sp.]MBK9767748.1 glycosyltransferase family 2 protein [Chloracidobacterium sp.]
MRSSDQNNPESKIFVGRNVFSWAPKVSIVIPAYNVADFIAETLKSVAEQKFRDYEVIVINDGSPDTPAFERAIGAFREDIVYIKQPSLGAGAARNTGIRHARGEIIAFLDGDDIWMPDFLASQMIFLGRGYDMVYCDALQFGMRSATRKTFMEGAPSNGEVTALSLLDYSCNVITSGTIAYKSALERAGLFEPERNKAHDFHLWVRMAKSGARIGYQRIPLLKYRVHLQSLSGDSVSRVKREIDVLGRVKRSIDLDKSELAVVDGMLTRLQCDLRIEYGKAYLLNEDFRNAYLSFAEANSIRPSMKLRTITWLARLAPRWLLNHYRTRRPDEIAFVPRSLPMSNGD